jgi:exosome complex component RRP40
MTFVTPGKLIEPQQSEVVGPGIGYSGDTLVCVKAGLLRNDNKKVWVESNQKRYTPGANDPIIGIITNKNSESYRVDIGSSQLANLNQLAFEGANRRNKPALEVGDTIFCRVSIANLEMEPEIECMNEAGRADGFGELKGGFLVKVSLAFSRR